MSILCITTFGIFDSYLGMLELSYRISNSVWWFLIQLGRIKKYISIVYTFLHEIIATLSWMIPRKINFETIWYSVIFASTFYLWMLIIWFLKIKASLHILKKKLKKGHYEVNFTLFGILIEIFFYMSE